MANGIDWFRWHHGSVNDPKFGLVAKKAGARRGDVITVWALVLELASANSDRGTCGGVDHEATDFLLGAEDGTTARILAAMEERALLEEGRVVRWDERQPKREREDNTAAERKRRQRAREADQATNERQVTPSHTESHHVTPREEKSREEKNKAESKAEKRATATRLPADWMPNDGDVDFCHAERPDLKVDVTAARFRDYWIAQPGAKGKKLDWPATWRNWVRNERRVQQAAAPPGYQTANDKARDFAERLTGRRRNDRPPDLIDINDPPS